LKQVALSTRVPKEVRVQLEENMQEEKVDRSAAVRKLLSAGLDEWRRKRALDLLASGKATFMKAAQIAGLNVWDFAELVKQSDVVWVKSPRQNIEGDIHAALAGKVTRNR